MKPATVGNAEVLTPEEVAKWLHLEKRQLIRFGVPRLELGFKTHRYLKADVIAWLERQRKAGKRQTRNGA